MNVYDIVRVVQKIAPLHYAADWDNVGLLVGAHDWPADSILLTIDLTWEVLQEAIDKQADMVIAYHPPIFSSLKSITDGSEKTRIILEAIKAGLSIYSPHTALDAAPGGVNDWLASAFGEHEMTPLVAHASLPVTEQKKVVTMCPANAVDVVYQAMSDAGAGLIGNYEQCAFLMKGSGMFYGTEGADPAIGEKGRVENVEETHLEMVCSDRALGRVINALRSAHPYEEPPIDIYTLAPRPSDQVGQGRLVHLAQAMSMEAIIERIKIHLGVDHLKVAIGKNTPETFRRIGICPGAGESLLDEAINEDAKLFFTGEMRHHVALDAMARGCSIILAGHTETERGYLSVLKKRLKESIEDGTVAIAQTDRSPFAWQ